MYLRAADRNGHRLIVFGVSEEDCRFPTIKEELRRQLFEAMDNLGTKPLLLMASGSEPKSILNLILTIAAKEARVVAIYENSKKPGYYVWLSRGSFWKPGECISPMPCLT